MSQRFCPECGGILFYDGPAKRFACKSCGLYATREQLTDLKDKVKSEEDLLRKKKRQQSEYLDWWLSKKS